MAYYKPQKIVGYMPHKMHKDDRDWIHAKLSPLEPTLRYEVCKSYTKVFEETFDAEPLPHRKMGRARYAANNRLRIYISRKFSFKNR